MIIERNVSFDEDSSIGYIECIYNSSNILMTIYFPKTNILYISFKRGDTYKYLNVSNDKYGDFEKSDSQGKFFIKEIRNKDDHPDSKEYKLFQSELNEAQIKIDEWKKINSK